MKRAATLDVPAFACTTDQFPQVMAAAIQHRDFAGLGCQRANVRPRRRETSAQFPQKLQNIPINQWATGARSGRASRLRHNSRVSANGIRISAK
jgi:hypothetical protein